ncbi:iron hydrogenase [Laetiporus sulphureus 93-53]|uniref:Cytosolic Fe-S cluster assembly factor NAR1 n=1 Tax=Laetiporus sulphureus 93-53 TaxID=1314785 RepID=A0A165F3E6_9APHY|nr:iron hydrogenase [Laetiporus sulphureus 93-53]KZT08297.1 iron hydrogenase [Laetiporus sulphureus 93-53]
MTFSGALTLTDLNDFITPSQACIKPVEQTNKVEAKDSGAASTQIQVDSSGSYYEVATNGATKEKKLETAQISLNDCLACSGCITSAESVLITMQSHTEVLNFLANNPYHTLPAHRIPVLSIAPQSLASLAASLSSSSAHLVDLGRILRRVQTFCTQALGFAHVFDTTFARHLALLEHAAEFAERRRGEGKLPMLASACPGWICYAEKTHPEMLPFISATKSPQQVMGTLVKEWMARRWCKRPDQIYHVTVMPCYDKKLEASRQDFYNEQYVTRDVDCVLTTGELEQLMREKQWDLSLPVVDESARPSFGSEDGSAIDLPELLVHPGSSSGSYLQSLISMCADASLGNSEPSSYEHTVRIVRSADYEENILAHRDSGKAMFKGAKCYGFRNLQNVVRKIGRDAGVQVGRGAAGRMAGVRARGRVRKFGAAVNGDAGAEVANGYDYVEVMACPGGCVNGGGQLRPSAAALAQAQNVDAEGYQRDWAESGVRVDGDASLPGSDGKWGSKGWTKRVEEAYWHALPTPPPSPPVDAADKVPAFGDWEAARRAAADRVALRVLSDLCRPTCGIPQSWSTRLDDEAEARRRKLFRTQYRAVESEVVGLAVKW